MTGLKNTYTHYIYYLHCTFGIIDLSIKGLRHRLIISNEEF